MLTLFIIILTDFICSSICRFSFEQKCMLHSWSFCYFAFYIMHQRYRFEKYNSCVKNRYVQKTTGSISYLSSVSPYIMYKLPEFECYMSTRQQTTFLKKKHMFFLFFFCFCTFAFMLTFLFSSLSMVMSDFSMHPKYGCHYFTGK